MDSFGCQETLIDTSGSLEPHNFPENHEQSHAYSVDNFLLPEKFELTLDDLFTLSPHHDNASQKGHLMTPESHFATPEDCFTPLDILKPHDFSYDELNDAQQLSLDDLYSAMPLSMNISPHQLVQHPDSQYDASLYSRPSSFNSDQWSVPESLSYDTASNDWYQQSVSQQRGLVPDYKSSSLYGVHKPGMVMKRAPSTQQVVKQQLPMIINDRNFSRFSPDIDPYDQQGLRPPTPGPPPKPTRDVVKANAGSNNGRPEQAFRCPDCGMTFRMHGYLTRHMRKHSDVMRFNCPMFPLFPEEAKCHCTGGFSRGDTYKMHMKTRHFIYPRGVARKNRADCEGDCVGCGEHFINNEKWFKEHIVPKKCSMSRLRGLNAQPKQ